MPLLPLAFYYSPGCPSLSGPPSSDLSAEAAGMYHSLHLAISFKGTSSAVWRHPHFLTPHTLRAGEGRQLSTGLFHKGTDLSLKGGALWPNGLSEIPSLAPLALGTSLQNRNFRTTQIPVLWRVAVQYRSEGEAWLKLRTRSC